MKCALTRNAPITGAIRPLDVAAIICVLAVLGAIVFAGAWRFRDRALRARCQANLLQIGTALQMYAHDNHGLLPDCTRANPRYAGPIWPWDLNTNLAADLATRGVVRANWYCPANPAMNDDSHWHFGQVRIAGYGQLLKGTGGVPRNLWCDRLAGNGGKPPAETELAFDATACVDDDYTRIQGALKDRSNHMRGARPEGGNLLFLDQHVAWRDFSQMQVRFTTIGSAGRVSWSY